MTTSVVALVAARIAAIWLMVLGAAQILREFRAYSYGLWNFDLDRALGIAARSLPVLVGIALWLGARRFAAATELDAAEIDLAGDLSEVDLAETDDPSDAEDVGDDEHERSDLVYPCIVAAIALIGLWFTVAAAPGVLYQIATLVMGPERIHAGWDGETGPFYTTEALFLGMRLAEAGLGVALIVGRTRIADAIDPDTPADTPWPPA